MKMTKETEQKSGPWLVQSCTEKTQEVLQKFASFNKPLLKKNYLRF
jgi:hypothetical protein